MQIHYLGETALAIYQSAMSELVAFFPCNEEMIMKQHEDIIQYAIKEFRDETLMDPDVEQFQTHLKEFTVSFVKWLTDFNQNPVTRYRITIAATSCKFCYFEVHIAHKY